MFSTLMCIPDMLKQQYLLTRVSLYIDVTKQVLYKVLENRKKKYLLLPCLHNFPAVEIKISRISEKVTYYYSPSA